MSGFCEESNLKDLHDLAIKNKIPHAVIIECRDQNTAVKEAIEAVKIEMCNSTYKKPCGICNSCLKIEKGIHPDVKILCPESNSIKVEEIRYVRQDAYKLPNESSYKFYVIKFSDYLTVQAQNAFIKILEEPPKNVIFILLCESSCSLLGTVLSRCELFRIPFNFNKSINNENFKLAEKLMRASIKEDKIEIFKLISQIPGDRIYLKNLIESILESFVNAFKDESLSLNPEKVVKKLDELTYISKLIKKNVNLNLLISYLSIVL